MAKKRDKVHAFPGPVRVRCIQSPVAGGGVRHGPTMLTGAGNVSAALIRGDGKFEHVT